MLYEEFYFYFSQNGQQEIGQIVLQFLLEMICLKKIPKDQVEVPLKASPCQLFDHTICCLFFDQLFVYYYVYTLIGECSGIMLRNVYCEQIVSSGIATIVDNDFCNEAEIPRPSKFCSEDSEDEVQDSKPEVVHTYLHLGPKQFP